MEERCINNNIINLATETHEAVRLRLTRNPAYTRNINCVMVIQPPPGKKLIVRFNELDIQQLQTGQCLDALVAIDGQDQASARLLQGNYMYLTYLNLSVRLSSSITLVKQDTINFKYCTLCAIA